MKRLDFKLLIALVVLTFASVPAAAQQQQISYALRYSEPISYAVRYFEAFSDRSSDRIRVVISLPHGASAPVAPVTLVMPRAIPMGYGEQQFDRYLDPVFAFSEKGESLPVQRVDGPRWRIGGAGTRVGRIEYEVNLARMEREILGASDSSRVRPGYVGLLGYSIFAFVEGTENQSIRLQIDAPASWPVFSTLAPVTHPLPPGGTDMNPPRDGPKRRQVGRTPKSRPPALKLDPGTASSTTVAAANFYALADSQIAMGPKLQVQQLKGTVPLFVAVYSEGEVDLQLEGELARDAMERVIAYFGSAPFPHYTVLIELLRPVSPQHSYGFSMEHLDSSTYYLGLERGITAKSSVEQRERERFNFAHHIAHAWIPKRAYGEGYFPFTWELAPIIDTIWLSEGFVRYVAIEALSVGRGEAGAKGYRQRQLDGFRKILDESPAFIRRMSLVELSRVGSTRYSEDFRIGRNLFSRGALMAAEMDERIRERTAGKKTFRDAMRYLVTWSTKTRRAFTINELSSIIAAGTGVDTREVMEKWMRPLE
jgi:predicted metalloprotease with PDZ domain